MVSSGAWEVLFGEEEAWVAVLGSCEGIEGRQCLEQYPDGLPNSILPRSCTGLQNGEPRLVSWCTARTSPHSNSPEHNSCNHPLLLPLLPHTSLSTTHHSLTPPPPQTRLNIPDLPVGGFAAAPGSAPAAAAPAEEEEAAPAAQEKSLFNLKLDKFDATSKPKVIKEIKALLGLSLVDSKKFVEAAPKVMKEGVPKEEAEKIVETLKAVGATVVME